MNDLDERRQEALDELGELGELWLERHVCRLENGQVSTAIGQAIQDVRRIDGKVERARKRCDVKG